MLVLGKITPVQIHSAANSIGHLFLYKRKIFYFTYLKFKLYRAQGIHPWILFLILSIQTELIFLDLNFNTVVRRNPACVIG